MGTSNNGGFFFFEANPGVIKTVLVNFAGEEIGDVESKLTAGNTYFLRLDLGLRSLRESLDSNGKSSGQKCSRKVIHFASILSSELEILNYMDNRAQINTCWPGFMFVTGDLAKKELPQMKRSK